MTCSVSSFARALWGTRVRARLAVCLKQSNMLLLTTGSVRTHHPVENLSAPKELFDFKIRGRITIRRHQYLDSCDLVRTQPPVQIFRLEFPITCCPFDQFVFFRQLNMADTIPIPFAGWETNAHGMLRCRALHYLRELQNRLGIVINTYR